MAIKERDSPNGIITVTHGRYSSQDGNVFIEKDIIDDSVASTTYLAFVIVIYDTSVMVTKTNVDFDCK